MPEHHFRYRCKECQALINTKRKTETALNHWKYPMYGVLGACFYGGLHDKGTSYFLILIAVSSPFFLWFVKMLYAAHKCPFCQSRIFYADDIETPNDIELDAASMRQEMIEKMREHDVAAQEYQFTIDFNQIDKAIIESFCADMPFAPVKLASGRDSDDESKHNMTISVRREDEQAALDYFYLHVPEDFTPAIAWGYDPTD